MVVADPGFIVVLVLNAFFLDDYDAYGEGPIPGSGSVHLPRGEVTINFHTVMLGNGGGGLPVPPLGITFTPPDGVEVVNIDKASNLLSDETCPDALPEAFLAGTAPMESCDHSAEHRNILQKIFGLGKN